MHDQRLNPAKGLALAGLLALTANTVSADAIDLDTPEGQVAANRKIQCSTVDEKPVVYTWQGRAYSRVPGERDRHLFNLDGMNIRQCVTVEDPVRAYRLPPRFQARSCCTWIPRPTRSCVPGRTPGPTRNPDAHPRGQRPGERTPVIRSRQGRQPQPEPLQGDQRHLADEHRSAAVLHQRAGRRVPEVRGRHLPRHRDLSTSTATWTNCWIRPSTAPSPSCPGCAFPSGCPGWRWMQPRTATCTSTPWASKLRKLRPAERDHEERDCRQLPRVHHAPSR